MECFDFALRKQAFLTTGGYIPHYWCQSCVEEAKIRCSHCDEALPDNHPLSEELDDGSFLCQKCEKQLTEELDVVTNNQ